MQSSSRKLLVVLIGLLVLGFVIYRSSGMIHHSDFSGTELLQAVRSANPYYLILSLVAIYACYALRALRWKVFQQNLGPSSFWNIYKMTLAGFSALQLLGRPGEPVRPFLLARKEKLQVSGMFGVYLPPRRSRRSRSWDFERTLKAAKPLEPWRKQRSPRHYFSSWES